MGRAPGQRSVRAAAVTMTIQPESFSYATLRLRLGAVSAG